MEGSVAKYGWLSPPTASPEFEFVASSQTMISSADELFVNGKLRPLHLVAAPKGSSDSATMAPQSDYESSRSFSVSIEATRCSTMDIPNLNNTSSLSASKPPSNLNKFKDLLKLQKIHVSKNAGEPEVVSSSCELHILPKTFWPSFSRSNSAGESKTSAVGAPRRSKSSGQSHFLQSQRSEISTDGAKSYEKQMYERKKHCYFIAGSGSPKRQVRELGRTQRRIVSSDPARNYFPKNSSSGRMPRRTASAAGSICAAGSNDRPGSRSAAIRVTPVLNVPVCIDPSIIAATGFSKIFSKKQQPFQNSSPPPKLRRNET